MAPLQSLSTSQSLNLCKVTGLIACGMIGSTWRGLYFYELGTGKDASINENLNVKLVTHSLIVCDYQITKGETIETYC